MSEKLKKHLRTLKFIQGDFIQMDFNKNDFNKNNLDKVEALDV